VEHSDSPDGAYGDGEFADEGQERVEAEAAVERDVAGRVSQLVPS
jgi:hypothetical protein